MKLLIITLINWDPFGKHPRPDLKVNTSLEPYGWIELEKRSLSEFLLLELVSFVLFIQFLGVLSLFPKFTKKKNIFSISSNQHSLPKSRVFSIVNHKFHMEMT